MNLEISALQTERDNLKAELRELETETRKLEAQQKTLRQREMRAKRKLDALGTLIDLAETEARADDGASSEAT